VLTVRAEGDKVIVDLCGRRRDVLLTPGEAERLAAALEENAALAEREMPELVRGEVWGAKVESFDGKVAIRFCPPLAVATTRVPLSAKAARLLAAVIRDKASWAKHKARLVLHPLRD
jgi:hypothetical protein